jgi:ABC-type uncharacterized transport system permease subunit
MQNAIWIANVLRNAVTGLLSGTLIPFDILPWGMGVWMRWLPFGSLAGAPLDLFVGTARPLPTLAAQAAWNVVIWGCTALVFQRRREGMMSYGG